MLEYNKTQSNDLRSRLTDLMNARVSKYDQTQVYEQIANIFNEEYVKDSLLYIILKNNGSFSENFLKTLKQEFPDGLEVELVEEKYNPEAYNTTPYNLVLKFSEGNDDVIVKIDGSWSSYDGVSPEKWSFVKAVEKTIIVYEKE